MQADRRVEIEQAGQAGGGHSHVLVGVVKEISQQQRAGLGAIGVGLAGLADLDVGLDRGGDLRGVGIRASKGLAAGLGAQQVEVAKDDVQEDRIRGGPGIETGNGHALPRDQRLEQRVAQGGVDADRRNGDRSGPDVACPASHIERLFVDVDHLAGIALQGAAMDVQIAAGHQRGQQLGPRLLEQGQVGKDGLARNRDRGVLPLGQNDAPWAGRSRRSQRAPEAAVPGLAPCGPRRAWPGKERKPLPPASARKQGAAADSSS